MFFWIIVCPFVLFLLAIVLSVLLRYTDSDNLFGIFKLFWIVILSVKIFFFGRYQHLVVKCIMSLEYSWRKMHWQLYFVSKLTVLCFVYYIIIKWWFMPGGLNIVCIMLKIRAVFIITLFTRLCVRVGMLFTCWK